MSRHLFEYFIRLYIYIQYVYLFICTSCTQILNDVKCWNNMKWWMFSASSLKTPCRTLLSKAGHWWCRRRCDPWCCWRCSNLWECSLVHATRRTKLSSMGFHMSFNMQCLLALHMDHQYMNHIRKIYEDHVKHYVYIKCIYCICILFCTCCKGPSSA